MFKSVCNDVRSRNPDLWSSSAAAAYASALAAAAGTAKVVVTAPPATAVIVEAPTFRDEDLDDSVDRDVV